MSDRRIVWLGLSGAALCALLVYRRGWDLWLVPGLATAAVSPALTYSDLTERRLPDALLLPGYVASAIGLVLAAATDGPASRLATAVAVAAGMVAFGLALALGVGGIGGGDIKLFGLVGLSLAPAGWKVPFVVVLLGFLLAAPWALGIVIAARGRGKAVERTIPFGPLVLSAAAIVLAA